VGRPNIGNRTRLFERIGQVLDRRWLTNHGPLVQELENRIAAMLGVRHCVAVANGTIALEIAIRALDLRDEVLVPSFTFVATAHALHWQQIKPVFCDINPRTHVLDPADVESRITPRTTGIIGVHLWGEPCVVRELEAIAARHSLKLLFDASHAFGNSFEDAMLGGFGRAEIFSFHATKYFNTFEGGAITTNDDELAARVRLMKNFGFSGRDTVISIGINGKMSEVSAAMGLTGLESLDDFISANRRNRGCYRHFLQGVPGVHVVPTSDSERRNLQHFVMEIDEGKAGLSRDSLVQVLHAENILARRYFYPGCHRMEPYRSRFSDAGLRLPVTESVCRRVLVLPTGTAVNEAQIETICSVIRTAIAHGPGITGP
jgi:dTDP-4-amino-4,6-dideoxygalactose transaminase